MSDANQATIKAFNNVVNMPANTLQDWLKTEHSLALGFKANNAEESVGHQSDNTLLNYSNSNMMNLLMRILNLPIKSLAMCIAILRKSRKAMDLKHLPY